VLLWPRRTRYNSDRVASLLVDSTFRTMEARRLSELELSAQLVPGAVLNVTGNLDRFDGYSGRRWSWRSHCGAKVSAPFSTSTC
jgi:hypothetical protein